MIKTAKKPEYQIEVARTKIWTPVNGVRTAFAHPFYGPNTAKALRNEIHSHGLVEPNGKQAAAFLAVAYTGEEPQLEEARNIMKNQYFRVFLGHRYDGEKGKLFLMDRPDFNSEGKVIMPETSKLIKRIKDGDSSVRAVPFSELRDGVHSPAELAKSKYVQKAYGKEGAGRLAYVASKTRAEEGFIWFPTLSEKMNEVRIAALGEDFDDGRLYVGGGDDGRGSNEHAFGVFPNAAKPRAQKSK